MDIANSTMHALSTTIAAIATPVAHGAIGVVRVSGPDSYKIADAVYCGKPPLPSERSANTFVRCFIKSSKTNEIIDEAIMLFFRAPHSYTRQDVVEIQCHGGSVQVRRVLEAVLSAGAEEAEPGEFTYRAFMNGRIDLIQAESVLNLIMSRSTDGAISALNVLSGNVSHGISNSYDLLSEALAIVEGYLNLPDDESTGPSLSRAKSLLSTATSSLHSLLHTCSQTVLLREGVKVVLCGPTNAGKSTIFNQLVGHDRAIVSSIPGTTRDVLEETIILDGVPVVLIDTAGMGEASSPIDTIAQEKTSQQIQHADVIIYVTDITSPDTFLDNKLLDNTNYIMVKNKIDLMPNKRKPDTENTLHICAIKGIGIPELRQMLSRKIAQLMVPSRLAISDRNVRLLSNTVIKCEVAIQYITEEQTELIKASIELKEGLQCLDEILGQEITPDILETIFNKFCVGK